MSNSLAEKFEAVFGAQLGELRAYARRYLLQDLDALDVSGKLGQLARTTVEEQRMLQSAGHGLTANEAELADEDKRVPFDLRAFEQRMARVIEAGIGTSLADARCDIRSVLESLAKGDLASLDDVKAMLTPSAQVTLSRGPTRSR